MRTQITLVFLLAIYFAYPINCLRTVSRTNVKSVDTDILVGNITTTVSPGYELEYYDYHELSNLTGISAANARLLGAVPVVLGQYPFMAYILAGTRSCSGVIISVDYILTAASCVYNSAPIVVTVAEVLPTRTATLAEPILSVPGNAIYHPHFYSNRQQHDIALIKLSTPLTLSPFIRKVRIGKKHDIDDYHDMVGKSVRVLGYGLNNLTAALLNVPTLRATTMTVMPLTQCYKAMRGGNIRPSTSQNCLDTDDGTVGMCSREDSGGSVLYKLKDDSEYTLVGIMSTYTANTCASSFPNLFTRIGQYLEFIERYVPSFVNSG